MGNVLEEDHIITDKDLEEFAHRAEELCSTGNNIIVSNFRRNNHLAEFINNFKPKILVLRPTFPTYETSLIRTITIKSSIPMSSFPTFQGCLTKTSNYMHILTY